MKLLRNMMLVERVKTETATTQSGILLPASALDDYNTGGPKVYRVLEVGPGKRNYKGVLLPMECQPGDKIICESYTEGAIEISKGRFVMSQDMVLMVLPIEGAVGNSPRGIP